jgi:carbonic anhydrase/acetyltransferase-like protein (isoleucine patch superfamily)
MPAIPSPFNGSFYIPDGDGVIEALCWQHLDTSIGGAVAPSALIDDTARIYYGSVVGPRAYIGANALIDAHCFIGAGVTIEANQVIPRHTSVTLTAKGENLIAPYYGCPYAEPPKRDASRETTQPIANNKNNPKTRLIMLLRNHVGARESAYNF